MVMVVIMHFLSHSDSLIVLDMPLSVVRIVGSLLEAFCLVAVNVYLLISGYFGVKGSFKPSRAVSLLCQIWFYALLIPVVLKLSDVSILVEQQGIYGLIQYLLPVETEHYWFATSYFMLYLLMPVLNKAVQGMTRRQYEIILGGLLILFCMIKSFSPVVFAFDRYGYDLPWFICVYLLAAYFGLYGEEAFDGGSQDLLSRGFAQFTGFVKKRGWLVYVLSCLGSFCIQLLMWKLSQKWDGFAYYFSVPYHYNFVLCLTGAIGLFFSFSKVKIKEGRGTDIIRGLGTLCFGIYLLHEHIDLRYQWYEWLAGMVNPGQEEGLAFFLAELLFCVAVLFVAGIMIDFIRNKLFASLAAGLQNTRIGRWLHQLDREMDGKGRTDEQKYDK